MKNPDVYKKAILSAVKGVILKVNSCHIMCLCHIICSLCNKALRNSTYGEVSKSQLISTLANEIPSYIDTNLVCALSVVLLFRLNTNPQTKQ